ncbi:MAG: hypothetical protein KAQ67_05315 [Gammaproteobacteria bacterium]|nr:hypothetical protein [Gammaproteobacteria bacterium]
MAAVYISIDKTSIVKASQPLSVSDFDSLRQIVNSNKPAAVMSSGKKELKLTNQQANELLRFTNQNFDKNLRASTKFTNNRINLMLSYQLPSNPVGRFVNIKVQLRINYAKYFIIEKLKIGHIPVPSSVLKIIQPEIVALVKKYYGEYFVLWKHIKRIDVTNTDMTVHYQIQRTDFKKLRNMIKKVLVNDEMRERITAYSLEMDRIINRLDSGAQSIINIVSPIFKFAEKRSLFNSQPIEENRIAILTLAAYVVDKNLLTYISDKPVKSRKKIKFTLKGRNDLAQHYLVSSGINAVSNTAWSNAIGLKKELKDSDGGSGFSFVDLMADIAGNKLAETAFSPSRASALQLKLKQLNSENDILGDISGLQEGLSATEFRMEFGNTSSEEYVRIVREIRRRLLSCSTYN